MDLNDDIDDCVYKDNYVNLFDDGDGSGDGGDVNYDGGNNVIEMKVMLRMK
jgi:hypothetical protein